VARISVLSSDVHCRACDGTGIFIPLEFLELERDIAYVLEDFPIPDIMGKGQWFFRPMTIVRTLAYMYYRGDIEGQKIVCLAAPTIAVGLAILQRKADLELSVSVLDIDTDILEVISKHFGSVHTQEYNLSNECPDRLKAQYDCFVFDPLYSEDHYRIGLSRCVQLIGCNHPDRFGYVVVPPEEIAPIRAVKDNKRIPLQLSVFRLLNEMGLCIADFKDNFMDY
jgi:predicted methyltransferase